ncbi:ATP-binding protein [Gemmatimonadota bacterium]
MLRSRRSIRRLLVVLLASLVIPLLGLLAYGRYREIRVEFRRAQEGLAAQADMVSMGIRQFLNDSERILEALARDPRLGSMDPGDCPSYFQDLEPLFIPTYTNLFTWAPDGVTVCSVLPGAPAPPSGVEPPGLEAARAAKGFHVGQVHQGTVSGRWTTALTYPIPGEEGGQAGLVILSVDLLRFQEILAKLQPPGGGIISVVERDGGTVVARSQDSDAWVGKISPATDAETSDSPLTSDRGFSSARTFEGVPYLWGFVHVPGTEWMVFAGLPRADIYGPIWDQWLQASLWALAILGLTVLLGILVHRRIVQPLTQLVAEISRAGTVHSAPLEIQGPEEIALVARRFNEIWAARGEAEQARQRADERILSLVENAVAGIYVSTESGRFLEVNQAMVDLLGYESRGELLATPVSALYKSEEDRLAVLKEYGGRDAFQGLQIVWRRKDGASVRARLFGRRVPTPEGEAAWEVVVDDITELSNLQEQYLQAQKMEALGRLAGGISHDFNNLLTVVQGQADLLLEDPRVGEDLKAQLREIYDAALRGGALNRQLLAFGRRTTVQETTLDLNGILRGFEIMLRRAAGEEIRLQLTLTPDLAGIRGNRSQLEQVIMNLVVNARDAMPRGGDLLIETQNTHLSEEEAQRYPEARPGPQVVVAISDTGAGIDPEILPHIFEPFFTTKPESKGTGLGLATVYGIVVGSGGHLRVESERGKGTTFRAFFPAQASADGEEMARQEGTIPRSGSGVILLAEDEEAVGRLTTRILERAGYQVLSAKNGPEALELALNREGPIHLLLSDVVMPGLRGPELAEALAREGRVRRAVFISGYAEGMTEAGPEGLDAWELVSKPFKAAELLNAVERVLKA